VRVAVSAAACAVFAGVLGSKKRALLLINLWKTRMALYKNEPLHTAII
jgi:hypothetical protein